MPKSIESPGFSGSQGFPPELFQQAVASFAVAVSTIMLPHITSAVEQIIESKHENESIAKLISADKACKLFDLNITKPTLLKWEKDGHFNRYSIGGRVFYKIGEILNAGKHLKRYKKEVEHG